MENFSIDRNIFHSRATSYKNILFPDKAFCTCLTALRSLLKSLSFPERQKKKYIFRSPLLNVNICTFGLDTVEQERFAGIATGNL